MIKFIGGVGAVSAKSCRGNLLVTHQHAADRKITVAGGSGRLLKGGSHKPFVYLSGAHEPLNAKPLEISAGLDNRGGDRQG